MMKLFLISQSHNNDYDTFDSAVVAAPDEETARRIDPSGEDGSLVTWGDPFSCWVNRPEYVAVKLIGTAAKGTKVGVICASFNAG